MQTDPKKYLILRIVFTVLSAIFIAAALPVGVFAGLTGVLICAGLAFIFYFVMLTFKSKQEALTPPEEQGAPSEDDSRQPKNEEN